MTITKSTVEKLTISGVQHLDPINVFFEDYDAGRGKVTIEVVGDAWSYFWGATARPTIKEFFAEAGTDYLVGKFSLGISSTVNDESSEALKLAAKEYILEQRRIGEMDSETARVKWEVAEWLSDGVDNQATELYDIFGDEWYRDLPQQPNVKYLHLCRIVNTIKEALKN